MIISFQLLVLRYDKLTISSSAYCHSFLLSFASDIYYVECHFSKNNEEIVGTVFLFPRVMDVRSCVSTEAGDTHPQRPVSREQRCYLLHKFSSPML